MSAADYFPHENDSRDESVSGKQSIATNQNNDSQEDSLYKMRKGLFGRSASYLQSKSGSNQKNGSNDDSSGSRNKISESDSKSAYDDEPMEIDTVDAETTNATGEDITEPGSSIASGLKTIVADIARDQKDLSYIKEINQQKDAESGKRKNDTKQFQVSTITAIRTNVEHVRESKEGCTEKNLEITCNEKSSTAVITASDSDVEQEEEKNDSTILENVITVASRTDGECSNESEDTVCKTADAATGEAGKIMSSEIALKNENEEQRNIDFAEETPTKKSTRSSKRHDSHTVNAGNKVNAESKESQGVGNGDLVNERRKSLRNGKTAVSNETNVSNVKNDSAIKERRKSLRTPKKPVATSTPTAKVIRREKKLVKDIPESESAKDKTVTSGRTSKKRALDTSAGSRSTPKSTKKETMKKKRARKSESDKDPFSIDNNFDNHPEPLRNIQVERQSFGGYKFTKSPESASTLRYQKTEQKANERRSNLIGILPQKEVGTHKSLSELTLSAGRRVAVTSSSKRKTKSLSGELSESGGSPNMLNSSVQQDNIKPKIKSRTDGKQSSSPYNFQLSPKQQRKRKITDTSPVVTPKRPPKIMMPELSALEQLEADHRPNEHVTYNVGARIYALWDRLYYPARISAEPDASGRYEVVFAEDGAIRKLVATGIIPLCNLVAGRKCLTKNLNDDEEVLEEVEIIEAPSSDDAKNWLEAIFTIKGITGENTSKSSWQKLVVDSNQAKVLQVTTVNTVRDINADNIASAEGRRSRAARHSAIHSANVTNGPTKTRRHAPTTGKEHATPSKASLSKNDEIVAKQKELQEQRYESSVMNGSSKKAVDKIFDGITFVVTSALRKNREGEQGFSKKEIRCMIECRGGKVIDDVMKLPQGKPIYLIADTHYRTHKYLTALARSIPCVSNQWISDCVKENKLLDHMKYMLPAGVSLLTGDMKPWHSNNGTLLLGKRVFISSNNVFYDMPSFSQIWTPIITHMGGTVVPVIPAEGLDILLTDASCTEEILNIARSQGATIVSSEWVIQAIIHGSLPTPEAHERFQYDYNDTCS